MKLILTLATIAALAAASVHAGGPVLEDTAEAAPERRNSWLLPVLGIAVLAIIAGSGGDCFAPDEPEPEQPGAC